MNCAVVCGTCGQSVPLVDGVCCSVCAETFFIPTYSQLCTSTQLNSSHLISTINSTGRISRTRNYLVKTKKCVCVCAPNRVQEQNKQTLHDDYHTCMVHSFTVTYAYANWLRRSANQLATTVTQCRHKPRLLDTKQDLRTLRAMFVRLADSWA